VILGDVVGDQHEMQLALVVAQLLAANEQNPRPQDEWKQPFDRLGWCWVTHCGRLRLRGSAALPLFGRAELLLRPFFLTPLTPPLF
jgi:hypothetical protein